MRTTLVLDDKIFRDAKRRAASRGITLSQLVNEALRAVLERTSTAAREYSMVTYGSGEPVHLEPADIAAIEEEEDLERMRK